MSCVTPGGKEQTGEDTVAPATIVTSWHESFSPEAFGLSSFQISWLRNSESEPKSITQWFAAQARPSRSLILPLLGSIVRWHSAWPPAWALCVILVSHVMTSRLYLVKSAQRNGPTIIVTTALQGRCLPWAVLKSGPSDCPLCGYPTCHQEGVMKSISGDTSWRWLVFFWLQVPIPPASRGPRVSGEKSSEADS